MPSDPWNPSRYEQFRDERAQPYYDLLDLVRIPPGKRVVDLGCGTGELTQKLHERLGAAETVGIDSSPNMLSRAAALAGGGLRFEQHDIRTLELAEPVDLIFSNAALQWVPGHDEIFARLTRSLAADGQLAVQLPAMDEHAIGAMARAVAGEAPFASLLGGFAHRLEEWPLEHYAELLFRLGYRQQLARMQVYGHVLASTAAVVDWVRGTLLTVYQRRLSAEDFERFVDRYRERLLAELGDQRPYYFPFKRMLIWGSRGERRD